MANNVYSTLQAHKQMRFILYLLFLELISSIKFIASNIEQLLFLPPPKL
mgnify:CR=1 FL=1